MRIGIEMAVSIFLLMAGVSLVFSVYTTAVSAGTAKQYHHRMVSMLEHADFDEEHYGKLQRQAKQDHYELDVTPVDRNGKKLLKVTLTYHISMPFLDRNKEYQVVGYSVLQGGI